MGNKHNNSSYSWRFYLVLAIFSLCFLSLVWRMVDLGVVKRSFLQRQSNIRAIRVINIPAHRGMITDRNGVPLAISTAVSSVWVNPQIFTATHPQIRAIAKLLAIPVRTLYKKIDKKSGRWFVYLQRRVNPNIVEKIKELDIYGLFFQPEYRRYYPEGEVTSQVLGFTNIDDRGIEGLELAFNSWLSGTPGKKRVLKDRLGHIIANMETIQQPQQGHNLTLSLDYRIQYLAYYELKKIVQKYKASSGSIVVLNVRNGQILAMVNQPSFNPNDRPSRHQASYRNRAVTDVFEPGSTMKAFSIASALASGKYTPETKIDTNPGWLVINGKTIDDEHINHGVLSVTGVLQKSSNIGVAKMVLSLPPENLWNLLNKLGFGERTTSGFPGEARGSLIDHRIWRPLVLVTLAYGYGVSVTPLQLARAYAIIADGGVKHRVSFLLKQGNQPGQQVMSSKVAHEMLRMLQSVVQRGGTGTKANIPGYSVAGKTGTAYIAGLHGYNKHQYMASFVGIAPVSDPQLVVAVVLRKPKKQHFGGLVAAPGFGVVMRGALQVMRIPPDEITNVS